MLRFSENCAPVLGKPRSGSRRTVLRFSENNGNEIIIHCLLSVAVKYSIESSVESLISPYEVHFGPGIQLDQENAHIEMYTAENGPILVQVLSYPILSYLFYPILVQADPLIKRALDK